MLAEVPAARRQQPEWPLREAAWEGGKGPASGAASVTPGRGGCESGRRGDSTVGSAPHRHFRGRG